ncbi:MAG: TPM domain-containing protein [Eggerthellaceae bacterium]|nr:TPM domain-containing protein [Eggerthellaceae bacterium]
MKRLIKIFAAAVTLSVVMALPFASQAVDRINVFGEGERVVELAYASEAQLSHVTDTAGLLDSSEVAELESKAQAIEDTYDFGVYIVTVNDYTDFSTTSVFDAAMSIYKGYSLGVGDGDDGLMLLMSMYDRDYSLITYGDFGNYAFNDDARESLTGYFLDDFSDDEWFLGFSDYLDVAALYTESARAGAPYTSDNIIMTEDEISASIFLGFAAMFILPLIIAFIVVAYKSSKMKSVAAATQAAEYALGGLVLTGQRDDFTHTTRVVTRVQTNNSPTVSHSGGFSGTSGKF